MLRRVLAVTLRLVLFLAAYIGSYLLVLALGISLLRESVLWLPTGVAVSGLILLGWRYWPAVALATLAQRILAGYTFPTMLLAPVGNTLEALTAVWLLKRLGFRRDLGRLQDCLALLAVTVVAPAVSATIGRTSYIVHHDQLSVFFGWVGWWRMNALGLLVVTPLALSWASPSRARMRPGNVLEVAALVVLVLALIWVLGLGGRTDDSGLVIFYLGLPLAMYAAVRYGVRGATTAGVGIVVVVLLGTSLQAGPFVITGAGGAPAARALTLQAVIALVMATPMLLGAAIAEREAMQARAAFERTERQDLLDSINRNVNEGLFRVQADLTFGYANTALARMLGYDSPEELVGTGATLLSSDPDRTREVMARLLERGEIHHEESVLTRRDGSHLPVLVSCTVQRGPDGAVLSFDGAISDMTGRKELEDQLRTTQKMEALGKLAGGVAHDFNNLLTVIGGHAEMLRGTLPADGPEQESAREIAVASARAGRLTHQLLAYSRRQMLEVEVLDLREVIDSMTSMLGRLIGEDVRLVTRHAPGPMRVLVDRGQIEQVVLNLTLNARDAMPGGGTLLIETLPFGAASAAVRPPADLPAGELVCLCVKDSGTGMAPQVASRAFDPFFTTKEPGKGTGLGLSTVQGIVRQSGGVVWIESAQGAGTAVRVCLPRVGQPAPAPPPAPPAAPRVGTPGFGTILVVEDDREVRELVARILGRAGYTLLLAEDGVQALDVAARAPRIDLLLTDAVMPRLDGRQLIATLAAARPGLRALLVSGYAEGSADPTDALGDGVAVLQKPFSASELLDRVRDRLASPPMG